MKFSLNLKGVFCKVQSLFAVSSVCSKSKAEEADIQMRLARYKVGIRTE